MLSVAQSIIGMYVSAQLCNAQGAAQIRFVRLPPRVRRPFAGVPVCDMSLTHGERLRVVACALTGKLVRLLSLHSAEVPRKAPTLHQISYPNTIL
jgi:hypothetical protein